ncbi:MAG: asparagine synthase (glutamine-hydrolyzing), partial [Blastomonas sp.]|nr:asparagine synthase (glutamine-hydrolyzing) [Blastomonas sp.]
MALRRPSERECRVLADEIAELEAEERLSLPQRNRLTQLRQELEAEGHRFRGHSDTEVLLEACERRGVQATVARLVGMYAFAFLDRATRRLTLGRDRFGKKPLYIAEHGGAVIFGSELRALRAHPLFQPALDRQAMTEFVRFGWVPAPLCIYRGVRQLLPGALAVVETDGAVRVERYWEAEAVAAAAKRHTLQGDDATLLDGLEAQLLQSVRQRMVADVPLGAFLSGGIDSSLVVSLMQSISDRPVKTFSIGFHAEGYDEAPHARAVATHLGTEHHELYVTPEDALAVVPRLPELWDEPFADSSQIPTYLVSAMARRHVTVALSGDGGDELFAGYSRYARMAGSLATMRKVPGGLARGGPGGEARALDAPLVGARGAQRLQALRD